MNDRSDEEEQRNEIKGRDRTDEDEKRYDNHRAREDQGR
jgi:hypothetical protein